MYKFKNITLPTDGLTQIAVGDYGFILLASLRLVFENFSYLKFFRYYAVNRRDLRTYQIKTQYFL